MKFWRAIMRKSTGDRIRNTYIRGEQKMEEIQNQMKERRLRWFGHVKRMDEHKIPKKIIGNEDEWKKILGQTMHMMDRPS
jgi:hypothetical protein